MCSVDSRSRFGGDTVTMSDAGTSSVHAPAGFPVQTMLYTRTICDLPTDFSFTRYTDQTLLIITQIGTAGEMGYHVSLDKAWIVVLVSYLPLAIPRTGTMIQATQDAAFDGSTTFSTGALFCGPK